MILHNLVQFAATCRPKGSIFGFPTWYKYLDGQQVKSIDITGQTVRPCTPVLNGLDDVWKVVFAIIDLLLRIAILAAIGFVLAGGVKFMTSQGQPDKIKAAITTLINALIGLVIAVAAATAVAYIGGKI
jgi:ABC-type Fe3+ transport system permease subunit